MSNTNSPERAKAGGEVGRNGERYKGGTFLPRTQLPKRGTTSKASGAHRVLVGPGILEIAPAGKRAIFGRISLFVNIADDGKLTPKFDDDHLAISSHFSAAQELHDLINLYNSGALFY